MSTEQSGLTDDVDVSADALETVDPPDTSPPPDRLRCRAVRPYNGRRCHNPAETSGHGDDSLCALCNARVTTTTIDDVDPLPDRDDS